MSIENSYTLVVALGCDISPRVSRNQACIASGSLFLEQFGSLGVPADSSSVLVRHSPINYAKISTKPHLTKLEVSTVAKK
jgi:hypothetical protein